MRYPKTKCRCSGVTAADARWFSILRGIQATFKYQNASSDDIFGYINRKSGKSLNYFFDQYFRHAHIPRLLLQTGTDGDSVTIRYRWDVDVRDFRMPVKVMAAPGKYRVITPTSEWQTLRLRGLGADDFKVAEDLYYIDVRRLTSDTQPTTDTKPTAAK